MTELRADLRSARERRGLTLDDVSAQARIPRHYIVALERGDVDILPHGRFRSAYHRQYRSFLGLPPVAEDRPTMVDPERGTALDPHGDPSTELTGTTGTMPRGDEIPTMRLIASGFAFTLLVVLVLRVGAVVVEAPLPDFLASADTPSPDDIITIDPSAAAVVPTPAAEPVPAAPAVPTAAQSVKLRAIEDVRVAVTTDEGTVRRGILPGGQSFAVESDGPITLEISDLTRVRVRYNGNRLEPLHNLSKGRRLVFVPEATD